MERVLSAPPHAAVPQRVLLVDPDDDTRDLYKGFLGQHRFVVTEATDGPRALAIAISDPPDIVVTETRLPGFDGYSLCEVLRRDSSTVGIPIVVLTAAARTVDERRALVAGADVVLVKPCLPDALLAAIVEVRARTQSLRDRSVQRLTGMVDRVAPSAEFPALGSELKRKLSKDLRRYQTNTPPLAPPDLQCPTCRQEVLHYDRSFIGGVSERFPEQWDEFACPAGCGEFQYRHRTRKLTGKPQ
jgi:DNA-binding response OmpR family regulator